MVKRDEKKIQSRTGLVPVFIQATDLPDSWFKVIWEIMEKGYRYKIQRGSYEGEERIELDFVTIHIKYPWVTPLIPDMPEGIPPLTSMDYVEGYFRTYIIGSEKQEGEQYTYGERITQFIKDDFLGIIKPQLEWAIEMLKSSSETNQATIEIAQPTDIVIRDKAGHSDPPCLRLIDCRIRYGKLHLIVYFRSWDAWNGYPANMAGIELLKQFMAGAIGVDNGELIACSKGLHVYGHVEELARMRVYLEKEIF